MTTLMELTMIPLDKGSSFSNHVAKTLDIIDKSELDYLLTPMGTIVEGEWSELISLLDACFKNLEKESARISISTKFDHRKDRENRLKGKTKSVEEKLGRSLNKTQ